jgi:uncharacterized protein (TIGR02588 family)
MTKENFKTRIKKITLIEWIVSTTGTLLFLFTLMFVLVNAITNSKTPADIKVKLLSVHENGDDFLLNVEVENKGNASVEGLEIEALLTNAGTEIEKGVTTFDYVPGNSKRKGGIFFKNNPQDFTLTLRPLGFEEP